MSSGFVQSLNPMKGKMEWKVVPEDYDFNQELARSGFADMVHDTERNLLYFEGLKKAINKIRERGGDNEKVHVLDIGTGTGLLSMMAAMLGADVITAIEEFKPMAGIAKQVIKANGFQDRIRIIEKRSTNLDPEIGKANILVTEVFDTELIGEAAIAVFNHAHRCLLAENPIVVPCEATVFAQIVHSDLTSKWNNLQPRLNVGNGKAIHLPADQNDTNLGSTSLALHDVQLTEMKDAWFEPITEPLEVFRIDFQSQDPIPNDEQTVRKARALRSGSCDAVFMWWELKMDPDKEVTLSCAPRWAHHDPKAMGWRDHWMQAIYYPLSKVTATARQDLTLISNHDEFSLWFDLSLDPEFSGQVLMPHPLPGIHLAVSRTRLGELNCDERNAKFGEVVRAELQKLTCQPRNLLVLSTQSLLPLILGANIHFLWPERKDQVMIYVTEEDPMMKDILQKFFIRCEILQNFNLKFISIETEEFKMAGITFDLVIGEPSFRSAILPWHNLFFWYQTQSMEEVKINAIIPKKARLRACAVAYKDLWKIKAPLGPNLTGLGFDMTPFDEVIAKAIDRSDAPVEPHPLWEYPSTALSDPVTLMEFDLTGEIKDQTEEISMKVIEGQRLNGMALWMEWQLSDSVQVSSGGPVQPIKPGQVISWDVHSKQGCYFFPPSKNIMPPSLVKISTKFVKDEGDINFDFQSS